MNETLKRALSGVVYVAFMWLGTSNEFSYPILFGFISILCIYEMWILRKRQKQTTCFYIHSCTALLDSAFRNNE